MIRTPHIRTCIVIQEWEGPLTLSEVFRRTIEDQDPALQNLVKGNGKAEKDQ